MIFRKFVNGEEISFCNVDTPEEALETLLDENATDHDEIMEHLRETIYGWQAALGRKKDGEPGDIIEIKGFAGAEDKVPAEVRKVNYPFDQLREAYPNLFLLAGDGKKGKRKKRTVTKEDLLELGNRFLRVNKRAGTLRKEFEEKLLKFCGLDHMRSDGSDVYVDLSQYGAGSMTGHELELIIKQLKSNAKREEHP